jgi:DNA repair protein RadC
MTNPLPFLASPISLRDYSKIFDSEKRDSIILEKEVPCRMSSEKSFSQSAFQFLVENAIYPMWSKKGEVYFRAKKGVLTPEKKKELVEELNLRTKEDKLPLSKLLAIILRTGKEGMSAEELAKRLLNHLESLRELDSVLISELCKIEGIGMAKAVQIKAAFELGKEVVQGIRGGEKEDRKPR